MSVRVCTNCTHDTAHNLFGKCRTPGCTCTVYLFDPSTPEPVPSPRKDLGHMTEVLRNSATQSPVAIPDEIIAEADRPFRAYRAHAGGMGWDEIAEHEHWDSPAAAAEAVKRYLDEGRAVWQDFRRVEGIAMEVARLNMLQQKVWSAAVIEDGLNLPAIHEVRGIIGDRIKLLRFDQVEPGDAPGTEPMPTTVVVGESTYALDLQRLAGVIPVLDVIWDDLPDAEDEPYLGNPDIVTGVAPSNEETP